MFLFQLVKIQLCYKNFQMIQMSILKVLHFWIRISKKLQWKHSFWDAFVGYDNNKGHWRMQNANFVKGHVASNDSVCVPQFMPGQDSI